MGPYGALFRALFGCPISPLYEPRPFGTLVYYFAKVHPQVYLSAAEPSNLSLTKTLPTPSEDIWVYLI